RPKLDKNSKPSSAKKDKEVSDTKHGSNKSKPNQCAVQEKTVLKTSVKSNRSVATKKSCCSSEPEMGMRMATRSSTLNSNCKPVLEKKSQLQPKSTKNKEVCQKKSVQELPKSKCIPAPKEAVMRRSQRLQQLTQEQVPARSLRSREVKEEKPLAVKQSSQTKRHSSVASKVLSSTGEKAEQKMTKIKPNSTNEDKEIQVEMSSSLKEKKCKADSKNGNSNSIQHSLQGLAVCPDESLEKVKKDQKDPVSPIPSSTKKVEADCLKPDSKAVTKEKQQTHQKVKTSTKPKKSSQLPVSETDAAAQPENDVKSKRVSILELCEEIAGEIESDTVEVKKDSPSAEYSKPEEKQVEVQLQQSEILTQKEPSQSTQCKRFFPSKKGMPVKCTLNGRNNSNKNSKWTKIKLLKASNMKQSNLNSANTPKLSLLKDFPEVSEASQIATEAELLKAQGKLSAMGLSENESATGVQEKSDPSSDSAVRTELPLETKQPPKRGAENGLLSNLTKHFCEPRPDEVTHFHSALWWEGNFRLHLESSPESSPVKYMTAPKPPKQLKKQTGESEPQGLAPKQLTQTSLTSPTFEAENRVPLSSPSLASKCSNILPSEEHLQKLKEAGKESDKQLIIDAGQKRFGAISCNICGMLYTVSNPEDETQHLLFHNQFISAVKYVGWKKERILAEYPDGKIIMVLPDDPKYALKKVEEIREMVDNDLGFQQTPLMCYSRTKTLLFISNDKKVIGCLIAEHIQWGYRVIEEKLPEVSSEKEKVIFERQKAWCCSTSPEPAICGISRIWVFSMMRRKKIASRMIECLRSNFIYGSYLSKEEIAFSDPTPDGKLFATQYCGTGQFLVYNFLSGQHQS
ncbi:ESCO1 acetyltransferase, partial [Alcedo cyanopectus]|nr:ESCO1 acetyltransferase [Ceyx cyanopectus]